MYSFQSKINEGITVDVDGLVKRQNKEWLRVCKYSTEYMLLTKSDCFILSKRNILEVLVKEYPKLVDLLTLTSGEVRLSSRRLEFAVGLLLDDGDEKLTILVNLLRCIERFDCFQKVYNSLKRKSGKTLFNPKLSLTPSLHSKVYDGDLEDLVYVLFGGSYFVDRSVGSNLRQVLVSDICLTGGETLVTKFQNIDFEIKYLDLLLELSEKDLTCKFLNKKLVGYVQEYTSKNLEEIKGRVNSFFYSFKDTFFKLHMAGCFSLFRESLDTTDKIMFFDNLSVYTEVNDSSVSVYELEETTLISPYCVNEDGNRLFVLNNQLGYVGTYLGMGTCIRGRLTSSYNPVTMYVLNEKSGKVEAVPMYNINWLRPIGDDSVDTSVLGRYYCDYYDYPFSLENLSTDEGYCSDVSSYIESFDSLILGADSYKSLVKSSLFDALRTLLDNEVCISSKSLDRINLLSSEEVECIVDVDALLSYILD